MSAKRNIRPPVDRWRDFDNGLKLQILANHYGSLKRLAIYTGIPVRSLATTLNALDSGKKSTVINRDDYVNGIRHARKLMTGHMRKIEKDFQAGQYTSPVIRHAAGVIPPMQYKIFLEQSKKVVDSFWKHYHVEHLPFTDQLEIARQIFEFSMETGEFNSFRFEYITLSSEYLESAPAVSGYKRRTFRDEGIKIQLQESRIIKLSTRVYPMAESGGNSDEFLDYISEERARLIGRGLIRITDLAFTNITSYVEMTKHAQRDYKKTKNNRRQSLTKTTQKAKPKASHVKKGQRKPRT